MPHEVTFAVESRAPNAENSARTIFLFRNARHHWEEGFMASACLGLYSNMPPLRLCRTEGPVVEPILPETPLQPLSPRFLVVMSPRPATISAAVENTSAGSRRYCQLLNRLCIIFPLYLHSLLLVILTLQPYLAGLRHSP